MYINIDLTSWYPGRVLYWGLYAPGDLQNTQSFPLGASRPPGDSGMRLSTTVKRGAVLSKEAAAGMISLELKAGSISPSFSPPARQAENAQLWSREALSAFVTASAGH